MTPDHDGSDPVIDQAFRSLQEHIRQANEDCLRREKARLDNLWVASGHAKPIFGSNPDPISWGDDEPDFLPAEAVTDSVREEVT